MNDRDQRANTKESHELSAPPTRKKIRPCVNKLFLIITFGLLTLSSYASDTNAVRAVQLMLSLKGYDLGYGDFKGIDGKLGQITREAIKDYQAKKRLTPTGNVDKWLYDSLYEDIKSTPTTQPAAEDPTEPETDDSKKINAISGELNTTKDDLKDTKTKLNTLSDNMDYHFITNFRDLAGLLAAILSIIIAIIALIGSKWINKKIETIERENDEHRQKVLDDAEKMHKEMLVQAECFLSAFFYGAFSAHCINLYKDFEVTGKHRTRQRMLYNSYLKIAKSLSDYGYLAAKRLEQLKPKLDDKDKKIIAFNINNKLFYSATPMIEEERRLDKDEVRKLYDELRQAASENSFDIFIQANYTDTMAWANLNACFSDLSEVENTIQPLLKNKRLPYEWRLDVYERYDKYISKDGNKLNLERPQRD